MKATTTAGPLVQAVHQDIQLSNVHYHVDGTSDPGEERERWTEITVYALRDGAYIVFGAGRSEVDGERDRLWMLFCATATDLIRALLRPSRNGGKHLPNYADEALRNAASVDAAVRTALAEWDSAARWAR